ncbi:redoxin domain-containing protein [Candidatus Peregrinibacteria bacterium]|nr:redoxin domain-containing protein [Candidatus Peregrinibacteria bacterium]
MTLLESKNLPIDTPAPDFSLEGTDGNIYSLKDFSDKKILVVIFMCNHCPYVQAIWSRLVDLQERFKDRGVQFVGINPNFHPDYPEETMEKMKEYYNRYDMNFPYLLDESQEVARKYNAQCTPDIYVFDDNRELAYHGRIDDSWRNEGQVAKEELADAIEALLADEKPSEVQNPSRGCSIKWRE